MSTALVVGEALIDEFPDRRVVAGAPLHVAVHLTSLGWDAAVVTRVGNDPDGDRIVATLEQYGVDTTLVERAADLPTGVTEITMDGTDHTFRVLQGAWDAIEGPESVPPADVICFGTLALRSPSTRAAVARLIDGSTATIVVDLNLRAPDFDRERIRWAVEHSDVLKLNDTELPIACAAFDVAPDPVGLHRFGPTWVCVTRGAAGAELSHADGTTWSAPAPTVRVVDTVGAGDAFCAALIDGLTLGDDPESALVVAIRRGADVAAQRGGLPEPPG